MTTASERQYTPLTLSGSIDEPEPLTKKSRNRKPAKKSIPHSSTLHGLWGKSKPTDERSETSIEDVKVDAVETNDSYEDTTKAGQPLVFKINPSKFADALEFCRPSERMITPPTSVSELIPETPVQSEHDTNKTPKSSRSSQKKRAQQQSPSEAVRRSPRHHRALQKPLIEKPVMKPHPFFLGKTARRALQAAAQPAPPIITEADEPPRKRQKSVSSDQASSSEIIPTLSQPKTIHTQSAKSLHPFFMSRTVSMESTYSPSSSPLLSLPQGKTVYLGNGKPAPYPTYGMNHIYDHEPRLTLLPHNFPAKIRKGKSTNCDSYGNPFLYTSLINFSPSINFIPPEKLIIPKSSIEKEAQSILTSQSHYALFRAYQILLAEDKSKDPDGQSWTHRFRPRRADEVLTGQTEGIDLRNWMSGNRKIVTSIVPNEMDDFIVDESEEEEEEEDSPRKRRRQKKETFMAYSNVVILTGPHGVGKTAAVEAVAEELGYQVFEISPGSKRAGKELMEAVGEVGQSELVTKHKGVDIAPSLLPLKIGSETMLTEVKSQGRKGLICLDEVDVLYEEDRGFWGCVTSLVEKSRRPVVMTCNDPSAIPENFSNCKVIEFSAAEPEIVRDYLRLITLSQGHIVDPSLLERMYIENQRDLRKTVTQVQFWCQFGIGDTRSGADWINWGGKVSDWVVSRGTCLDGVEWRQEAAAGGQVVLETIEEAHSDLDIEDMMFPQEFPNHQTISSQTIFKRESSVFNALRGIAEFLDSMSFIDCTVDRQFTAYEVTPYLRPSPDDVLSEPVLRNHPGQRYEKPQGGESRLAPAIRIIARKVLQEKLEGEGYRVPPLSTEKIINQPSKDLLHPRPSLSREDICDAIDGLLFSSTVEDRYNPTTGTLHSLDTVILDVVPQIRHILRTEHSRQHFTPEQMLLQNLWSNKRKTRGQVKEEREGRKRYFERRVDAETVLKTWLEIPCTENNDHIGELHNEE